MTQYDKNVIFDEIQNVPELFSYIQTIVDESGLTGQFILTGSQNFLILEKITQSLAGRVYLYHLLPFSQKEIKSKYQISSNETIQSWLYLLETSFILYRFQPWHINFNKRIVKTPKIYFYDTGLVCHLLGITKESDLDIHFIKGAVFENYIITELVKQSWNKGKSLRY